MPKTLLQNVQQACNEIGIPEPAQLVGNLEDQAKQLLALAQRESKEFSQMANSRGGWQALHVSWTFNTVAGVSAYDLPPDLDYFLQRTYWDNAYKWELIGPISAQEKQILKYGIIANGPRRKMYVQNNRMVLVPTPTTSGELIAYDYFTKNFCVSASGTPQSEWLADTDTYLLDDDVFVQGLKWRFKRAKGLDYGQEKIDYDQDCSRVLARDGGAPDLYLDSPGYGNRLLNWENLPETGYGGVTP